MLLHARQRLPKSALWSLLLRPLLLWCAVALMLAVPAVAAPLPWVDVGKETDRIEVNGLGTFVAGVGDRLQIETAPGADGVTDRMSVPAATGNASPQWFVFALRNVSESRIERLLSADRYNPARSGILKPRLDTRQIEAVTPSLGFLPENLALDGADAFRLTIEPGQTVTFAVEFAGDAKPRLMVSRAADFEKRARNRQLFNGVLLGITGLLAIFLSAVFAANHKIIFPAAALFTWCVLAYLCVDFGFWHKLFNVRPEDNALYRAATEAFVAAALLIFTLTFLRVGAWHNFARVILRLWIAAQLALVAVAFIDPVLAATFARLSMGGIFLFGIFFIVILALQGQDRALSLVPTWLLLGLWVVGMALVLSGRLQSEATATALTSGLVLIVLLIGFTVTQYAFRATDQSHALSLGEQGIHLLALENSGASVWEWSARRDEIKVGNGIEQTLGLEAGDLQAKTQVFLERMHPVDRDRMRQALDSIKDAGKGDLRLDFRLRHIDNDYRWFTLDAAGDPSSDARRARLVGLVRETTDSHSANERSSHDAVRDALTNLPNRTLFMDRLTIAVDRSAREPLVQPAIIIVDIDRVGSTGTADHPVEGDGLIIALSRRIGHLIGPGDTLARIGPDQFAILLCLQRTQDELRNYVEQVRLTVRSLVKIGPVEIVPKGHIGYSIFQRQHHARATDLFEDAEIAMHRARRSGRDAVVPFTPDLRIDRRERAFLEADLREAIDKKTLSVQYQPIHLMRTQEIAGYEALVRWEHPKLGKIDPAEFVPIAEGSDDLIEKLGSAVISMAVEDLVRWHKVYERPEAPLTVSVNISRRQLMSTRLVDEVRRVIANAKLPRGALRLEITETLVMENPEKASTVLGELAAAGAGLSLDDFGTGYSSLTYLNIFPFDTLKIDRALVQGAGEAGTLSAILRSVIALSHELGKKVVAEGIETEQDAAALRALNCEYGQGFYYAEPQAARDVEKALKELYKAEQRLKSGSLLRRRERKVAAPPRPAQLPKPAAEAGNEGKAGLASAARTGRGRGKTAAVASAKPPPLPPAAVKTPASPTSAPTVMPSGPMPPPRPSSQPPAAPRLASQAALTPLANLAAGLRVHSQRAAVVSGPPPAPAPAAADTAALGAMLGKLTQQASKPPLTPVPPQTGAFPSSPHALPNDIASSLARLAAEAAKVPASAQAAPKAKADADLEAALGRLTRKAAARD